MARTVKSISLASDESVLVAERACGMFIHTHRSVCCRGGWVLGQDRCVHGCEVSQRDLSSLLVSSLSASYLASVVERGWMNTRVDSLEKSLCQRELWPSPPGGPCQGWRGWPCSFLSPFCILLVWDGFAWAPFHLGPFSLRPLSFTGSPFF